jgi:hypothetical protein
MACVGLAKELGVDPELALRSANRDFEARAREAAGEPAGSKSGAAE